MNDPVNNDDPNGNIIPLILAAIATAPAWVPYVCIGAAAVLSAFTVHEVVVKPAIQERAKTKSDPYARQGQKEQGREVKEKKKADDTDWKSNPNTRQKPLPKHTPSKKGHRKF